MQPSIKADGLSKRYRIGVAGPAYRTLRETLVEALSFRRSKREEESKHIWALNDVSFQLEPGEVVGIIGRNGAGKSTLLRVLARITEPTSGRAELHGRLGSLLDLGTGFHSELSGRENIFLNGAILGMRKQEVARQLDAIIEFAGVSEFIDTPIKHYSSGMRWRLAFAVAAHLDTEILLADEVLAVGDAAFQKKCLEEMGSLAEKGRTVLLVSHNMGAIGQLCRKAMLIDHGRLADFGPARNVIGRYLAEFSPQVTDGNIAPPAVDRGVAITKVLVTSTSGHPAQQFDSGSAVRIAIQFRVASRAPALSLGVNLVNETGIRVLFSWVVKQARLEPGVYGTCGDLKAATLPPGRYRLVVGAYHHGVEQYHTTDEVAPFSVINTTGDFDDFEVAYGVTYAALPWEVKSIGTTH